MIITAWIQIDINQSREGVVVILSGCFFFSFPLFLVSVDDGSWGNGGFGGDELMMLVYSLLDDKSLCEQSLLAAHLIFLASYYLIKEYRAHTVPNDRFQ